MINNWTTDIHVTAKSYANATKDLPFALLFMCLILLLGTISGCGGPRSEIILLPSQDGRPSAVVIYDEKGDMVLDQPYSAYSSSTSKIAKVDEKTVQEEYADVLKALPLRQEKIELYFKPNSDELSEETVREEGVPYLLRRVKERAAPEITIVGHTDTVGNDELNDRLSLERAMIVRNILKSAGLTGNYEVVGRGKRFPKINTGDGVDEPRNRRVEIIIR